MVFVGIGRRNLADIQALSSQLSTLQNKTSSMVSMKDVRSSNASFKESCEPGLVAVFVGATSGIGLGTLRKFAAYANAPRVYVVVRSKSSAAPLLNELKSLNPSATFTFIESQVSLMKNVDIVTDEIKSAEKKVDILFMSVGYIGLDGRDESSEGIDKPHALRLYTRFRFLYNLLPLLTASSSPRVISILAGGKEEAIDMDDLEVRNNFSFVKGAISGTTQTTLAMEELAKSYPTISYIHKYPGFVSTGLIERIMGTAAGIYALPAMFARWVVAPILNFFSTSIDVAGERGLFIATSARYPPAQPKTEMVGVPIPKGLEVAQSSIVKDGKGNGVYRLLEYDDSAPEMDVLTQYRLDGADKKIWENIQTVWDRALGRSS